MNPAAVTRWELPPGADNPRNSEGDFIRLNDGRILFAYSRFTGSDSDDWAPCDIAALYSEDEGKTFPGEPRILVRAADYGVNNLMSVSLMRMDNGDLGMFFIVLEKNYDTRVVLLRSRDEGETFDPPIHVLPVFHGYYVLNNCRIERTATGRLIAPAAWHRVEYTPEKPAVFDGRSVTYLFCSDDDGFSWHEARDAVYPCFNATGSGLQEPGVITLPSGCLMGYARTDKGCQYRFFSYDDGESWTVPEASPFTGPCSPLKIARNPYSGIYYGVWNPLPGSSVRTDGGWGRTPLVMAQSADGVHFDTPVILENTPQHGYCYPAIFFPDEKTMLLSYCSGGPEDGSVLNRTTIARITL